MLEFLLKILAIDSTSGQEEKLADYLLAQHKPEGAEVETQSLSNGKKNLFFKWGTPKIIFSTHLDTVPPYIPPHQVNDIIYGRGACDAKGQIAVMYEVCNRLHQEKCTNFGLLLVAGEELGTYGAKDANEAITGSQYVIIGEPTDNKLIKAAKGTLWVEFKIHGSPAHSGYPESGSNAIEHFRLFLNSLSELKFPEDAILGKTTYNIGLLSAENACNVIPSEVKGKILFRTTFKTHDLVHDIVQSASGTNVSLNFMHGDPPMEFYIVDGFATDVVSFGSDAQKLFKLGKCLLYGAGNILMAHADNEQIRISELEKAVDDLQKLYHRLEDVD